MVNEPSIFNQSYRKVTEEFNGVIKELEEMGYSFYDDDGEMCILPLYGWQALWLSEHGFKIYKLYDDGTEALAESKVEIISHAADKGLFGIEWE